MAVHVAMRGAIFVDGDTEETRPGGGSGTPRPVTRRPTPGTARFWPEARQTALPEASLISNSC